MTPLYIEVISMFSVKILVFFALFLVPFFCKSQNVSSIQTNNDLRNRIGTNGYQAITNGNTNMLDGKSGVFVWCDTCTGTDDSVYIIKNPLVNVGRWKRLSFASLSGLVDSVAALKAIVQSTGKFYIYDKTGLLSQTGKLFSDTFALTSSTPTISLTSILAAMGCTNFKLLGVTGYRSGAGSTNAPNVAVSAITSNSVSLVFNQQNTAVVSILGINVLSGTPLVLVPDPTNVKAILSYYAW